MSRVVARGRFRVDRRRALKKMERFQLEDPLRYVLEWVAAAVVAGAEAIDIRNDSDDFELAWEGTELSRDDLDGLFDHLFGRPEGRHEAVLQHLVVGVLGALARSPRWLHVDAGALRLAVDDPADCAATDLDEAVSGVRCHVRDGLTQETVLEALLLAFRDPAEARLVQGAARWCPVPVRINGTPLPAPVPPPDALLALTLPEAQLWIVPDEEGHGVDVVRHGIVVHELRVPLAPCRVVGWIRADGVRLNASRSAVVDGDLADVEARLKHGVDQLLHEQLPLVWGDARSDDVRWGGGLASSRPRCHATRGELLDALGRHGLVRAGKQPGALAKLSVLIDMTGQAYALAELAHRDVGWVDDSELLAFADGRVVFEEAVAEALVSLDGARDLGEELRAAQKVSERRARLAQAEALPWAAEGRPLTHTVQRGAWRLGLCLDEWRKSGLRVELRTAGRLLATERREGPGAALVAVVDGPFELGGSDASVVHDAAYDEAMAGLEAEAWRMIAARVAEADDEAQRVLVDVLRPRLDDRAHSERLEVVRSLPEGVAQLAVWAVGGERISTERLFAGVAPRFVVSTVPAGCPEELKATTLVVPGNEVHRMGAWLGSEHMGDEHLARAVRVAHVLNGPKHEPRLVPPPALLASLTYKGLTGELGHPGRGRRVVDRVGHRGGRKEASPSTRVRVLWRGVAVGEVPYDGLPGAVGVVQGDELPLDTDLRLTDAAVAVVRQWADRALRDLMLQLWDEVPPGDPLGPELMAWLVKAGGTIPEPEQHRPVLHRVSGEPLTLYDLRRLDRRRKGERKLVVLPHPPGDVAGFDDAVVARGQARRLLEQLSRRGWRDGERDLQEARERHHRFVRRPPYAAPQAPLFTERSRSGGLQLAFYLPREPEDCGRLEVVALHEERPLARRSSSSAPGLLLLVRGLAPNRRCTDVDDSKRLTALKEQAEDRLESVVEKLLEGGVQPADEASWRGLAARLKVAAGRERRWRRLARTLGRQPLLTGLEGQRWSPEAIVARSSGRQPVQRVAADTRTGPADHDGYVLDEPGVAELLEAWLGKPVPDGTGALATWREGERRRREAPKVKPRRHGRHVRKMEGEGLRGYLSLQQRGSAKLRVDPICEGVDLADVDVPFAVAAVASVTGEAVVAAAGWSEAEDPNALASTVRDLATETMHGWVSDRGVPESVALSWVLAHGPDAPSGGVAVFPTQRGERVSLRALVARGTVAVVSQLHPRLPEPIDAVIVHKEQLKALRRHVAVESYRGLQALMGSEPRKVPPRGSAPTQWVGGGALWPVLHERPTIDVLCDGVVIGQVTAPLGLRMEGSVVPRRAVQPLPSGEGLEPGEALDALMRDLQGWGQSLAEQLAARLPSDERARQLLLVGAEDLCARRQALVDERDHPALNAPLVRDTTGAWGILREVVACDPIRCVEPGVHGAPERGRVWQLERRTRDALSKAHSVEDYTHTLAAEEEQRSRKARRRVELPTPPRGAEEGREGPFRYALWSHPAPTDAIMVVVDGSRVHDLSLGGAGVTGFVEGPFETDAAFTQARVPRSVRRAMSKAATRLLQAEWRHAPEGFAARAIGWHAVGGSLREGAIGWVDVARDGRGRPVSLRRLSDRRRGWAWAAAADGSSDTLVCTPGEREALEQLTGVAIEPSAPPAPAVIDLVPTAQELLGRNGKGLDEASISVPDDLLAAGGRSDAGRLLAAWWVAGRSTDHVDEVELVSRLAKALGPLL